MEIKQLKEEIKYAKMYLFSIFARSVKYLITTGTNTVYITNVHPNNIVINDIGMDSVVSKVTYTNFDRLIKLFPVLTIPNLCITRDILSTIFNKTTQGANPILKENKLNWNKNEMTIVEDGLCMKYGFKQRDDNYYIEGLDRDNNRLSVKLKKIVYKTIPIAITIPEAMVKWYITVCDIDVDRTNHRQIKRSDKRNLWFVTEWDGISIPYADGIIGISLSGLVEKIDKKDINNHFVDGYMQNREGYKYLITEKKLEEVSVLTIPKVFKTFTL